MKRLSWKYVAGLFDGEGCVVCAIKRKTTFQGQGKKTGVKTHSYYRQISIELTLTESSKHVIDHLQNNYGGNVYRAESRNPNWKPTYTWKLRDNTKARAFCQNIYKHCMIKNEQLRLAIWAIDMLKGKLAPEVAETLKQEFKLQKSDPHRLSEKAQENILELLGCDSRDS